MDCRMLVAPGYPNLENAIYLSLFPKKTPRDSVGACHGVMEVNWHFVEGPLEDGKS